MRSSPEDHTEAGWAPAGTNEVTIAASPPMRFTRKRAERRKGSLNVSMPAPLAEHVAHARAGDGLGAELRGDGARERLVEAIAVLERDVCAVHVAVGVLDEVLPREQRAVERSLDGQDAQHVSPGN